MNVQPHHGAFAALPKQNDKCPTKAGRGCLLWHMVYMLQLKINFRLKFFNLCLFSISFVS